MTTDCRLDQGGTIPNPLPALPHDVPAAAPATAATDYFYAFGNVAPASRTTTSAPTTSDADHRGRHELDDRRPTGTASTTRPPDGDTGQTTRPR